MLLKDKMEFAMISATRDGRSSPEVILKVCTGAHPDSSLETPKGYKPKSRCIIRKTGQEAILYERDQEEEQVEHLQTELAKVVETCGEIAKSLRYPPASEDKALSYMPTSLSPFIFLG